MHEICYESRKGNFLSNVPRTVDGVVLDSRDERDEDCVITFQTESVIEKFLLKFERLQMDCNDHLYIYDGAHVAGHWRGRLQNYKLKLFALYFRLIFLVSQSLPQLVLKGSSSPGQIL